MSASALYFTISIAEVATTAGVAIAGPALIEGTALLGIKALSDKQGIAVRVAKYVLAIIAALSALCLTTTIASTALFGFLLSVSTAEAGSSFVAAVGYIAIAIGAAAGLATLPFHWKAVQWSGLFLRKEQVFLNQA